MRTREEIYAQVMKRSDVFGFRNEVLVDYLTNDQLQAATTATYTPAELADRVTAENSFQGFGPHHDKKLPYNPEDREFIIESMRYYAAFGWQKIEDQRGISAGRTLLKMSAWLWLLGDDEGEAWCHEDYNDYGAAILEKICKKYGFPARS